MEKTLSFVKKAFGLADDTKGLGDEPSEGIDWEYMSEFKLFETSEAGVGRSTVPCTAIPKSLMLATAEPSHQARFLFNKADHELGGAGGCCGKPVGARLFDTNKTWPGNRMFGSQNSRAVAGAASSLKKGATSKNKKTASELLDSLNLPHVFDKLVRDLRDPDQMQAVSENQNPEEIYKEIFAELWSLLRWCRTDLWRLGHLEGVAALDAGIVVTTSVAKSDGCTLTMSAGGAHGTTIQMPASASCLEKPISLAERSAGFVVRTTQPATTDMGTPGKPGTTCQWGLGIGCGVLGLGAGMIRGLWGTIWVERRQSVSSHGVRPVSVVIRVLLSHRVQS